MTNISESILYAVTMIQPNCTLGGTYGISNGEDIKPFLSELMVSSEVNVICLSEKSYILNMDVNTLFNYIEDITGNKIYNKDKEEFIYKPKMVDLIALDLYLQKHSGKIQTIGLYSQNDTKGIVKDGISYIGLHLTYEDILPFLEKYNCVVKVGNSAVQPKEIISHLYNDKSISQCFTPNRTNTGILLTIKVGKF